MTMRAYTSEWWIASKHDARRGLWYREKGGVLEFDALVNALDSARYAREINGLPILTGEQI